MIIQKIFEKEIETDRHRDQRERAREGEREKRQRLRQISYEIQDFEEKQLMTNNKNITILSLSALFQTFNDSNYLLPLNENLGRFHNFSNHT